MQIFDPVAAARNDRSEFPLFHLFPLEIRQMIWEFALPCRRYIRVQLFPRVDQADSKAGRPYDIVVCGYRILSKLLRVNRESRDAVLHFYRVRLPCEFCKTEPIGPPPPGTTKHGTLYISPEYDILQVTSRESVSENAIIDFFYHLKTTYDPLRVGTRNLAMDLGGLKESSLHLIRPSNLSSPVRLALVELLTNLREFYFVVLYTIGRRFIIHDARTSTAGVIYIRSFPLLPMAPGIEYWSRDPRPIDKDLTRIQLGATHLQIMIDHWQRVLSNFAVSPPGINYQILYSSHPQRRRDITDRESAEAALHEEELQSSLPSTIRDYGFDDAALAMKPAFGFWLFPLEVIGRYPEPTVPKNQNYWNEPDRSVDLTKYWPILATMSVPG